MTDFISLNKPDHQGALHRALTEMNTPGFIGRNIKSYSPKHSASLCKKKFSFPQSQLKVKKKTLFKRRICFASGLSIKIADLNAVLKKDHFNLGE